METKLTYSNPRFVATINDWPWGRQIKTTCQFVIERDERRSQERAVRIVMNPDTGVACAPKKLTFADKMTIVDGSDGKTYIAALTGYGHITIWQGNMKFNEESIFPDDKGQVNPRYHSVLFACFNIVVEQRA